MTPHDRYLYLELVSAAASEVCLVIGASRITGQGPGLGLASIFAAILFAACALSAARKAAKLAERKPLPDLPRRSAVSFGVVSGGLCYGLGAIYLRWGLQNGTLDLVVAAVVATFTSFVGNFFVFGLVAIMRRSGS